MNPPVSDNFQGSVYNPAYPGELESIFLRSKSDQEVLDKILPTLGDLLKVDYCFLYLRHPQQKKSKITHYWQKANCRPPMVESNWHSEDEKLMDSSLFKAAINAEHSVFVSDVNAEYKALKDADIFMGDEQSLVQGHILKRGQLWGILRVCVLGHSRQWMQFDRSLIIHSVQRLVPHVINCVDTQLS